MDQKTQENNKIEKKLIKAKVKPYTLSTEVFKGKEVPPFIRDHYFFKNPVKIQKIFPAIGLRNFKEPCDLSKPLLDLKKDNFVTNLIHAMLNALIAARDEAQTFGDRIQFIMSGEDRANQLGKIDDIYKLANLTKSLIPQLDTYNNAFERIIQTSDGKIVLRLVDDVCDINGKAIFQKDEKLFKVFTKLREMFLAYNLNFINLDQTPEFKTFSSENVANKKYMVVFSSEGVEGAWDILTMSMRGIKSCQRWDGEYHRCLIGSILSKYVGVIYITSGADFENKGTKMMRRSLVRYAVDADEGKPCILIDKIYPVENGTVDEETLKIFTNHIKARTNLPVYFAPTLANKSARHFYVPFEKRREETPERDWTYQDTPLKTNLDFQLHMLTTSNNEDVNRHIACFRSKLITYLGEYLQNVLSSPKAFDPEISRTIANIRFNYSIDKFNEQFVRLILDRVAYLPSKVVTDPRDSYRKYLLQLVIQMKGIRQVQQPHINHQIDQACSRAVNYDAFCDFLCSAILKFAKQELKNLIR